MADRPRRFRLGREPRQAARALIASATLLDSELKRKQARPAMDAERLWRYYGLGEVHYAVNYRANAISKLRLRIVDRLTGEDAPDEVQLELIGLRGGEATHSTNLRAAAQNMDVAGEHYLLPDPELARVEGADPTSYVVRSTSEIRVTAEGVQINGADTDRVSAAEVARIWLRHPQRAHQADSPIASVSDTLDELQAASLAGRALSLSRAASNGILLRARQVSFGASDPTRDAGTDPMQQELVATMTAALSDPGSAAAAIPVLATIDAELIEKAFRHIRFTDPQDKYPATDYILSLIRRFANAVNLPAEVVTGLADVNHWTAWQIDDSAWRMHIAPTAEAILDGWTVAYLWPRGVETRWIIGYDASEVVQASDQSEQTFRAIELGLISRVAGRRELGYPEEDAGPGVPLVAPTTAPDSDAETPQAVAAAGGLREQALGVAIALLNARVRTRVQTLLELALDDEPGWSRYEPLLRATIRDGLTEAALRYSGENVALSLDVEAMVDRALAEATVSLNDARMVATSTGEPVTIDASVARRVLQVAASR